MAWFPGKSLGAGCAQWAVDTAEQFNTELCSRLGMRSGAFLAHDQRGQWR
jgi:hypothetical protein